MKKEKSLYHHGNLRQSIVDNVLEKLSKGTRIQQISIRKIAEELNVSKGAPYRHFNSQEALIAEIAVIGFLKLSGFYQSMLEEHSDDQPLKVLGLSHLNFAMENPNLYEVMFYFPESELNTYPELSEASKASYNDLVMAVTQSNLEITKVDKSVVVIAAWSLVHGLAQLVNKALIPSELREDHHFFEQIMSMLVKS